MKRLEELGISPAPWGFADDGIGGYDIRCSGVSYDEDYEGEDIIAQSVQKKDASMLAAAPELYDMLQSLVEYIDRECVPCGETACELLAAAHNVLSKAAGEEVGDGK